jgi:hypothetical protein
MIRRRCVFAWWPHRCPERGGWFWLRKIILEEHGYFDDPTSADRKVVLPYTLRRIFRSGTFYAFEMIQDPNYKEPGFCCLGSKAGHDDSCPLSTAGQHKRNDQAPGC